jgi:hypothetical protein
MVDDKRPFFEQVGELDKVLAEANQRDYEHIPMERITHMNPPAEILPMAGYLEGFMAPPLRESPLTKYIPLFQQQDKILSALAEGATKDFDQAFAQGQPLDEYVDELATEMREASADVKPFIPTLEQLAELQHIPSGRPVGLAKANLIEQFVNEQRASGKNIYTYTPVDVHRVGWNLASGPDATVVAPVITEMSPVEQKEWAALNKWVPVTTVPVSSDQLVHEVIDRGEVTLPNNLFRVVAEPELPYVLGLILGAAERMWELCGPEGVFRHAYLHPMEWARAYRVMADAHPWMGRKQGEDFFRWETDLGEFLVHDNWEWKHDVRKGTVLFTKEARD